MGSAIAQRLASLGHEMMVWNRSADKARSLGLPVAATPQALASACEMVISILTDANAVDQVYGEMLKADVKGKLFIEMSTVRPDVQKALSQKVLSRGARLVECPVGGTIGPAKEGKLFGFAGGEVPRVPADRLLVKNQTVIGFYFGAWVRAHPRAARARTSPRTPSGTGS